MNNNIIKTPQQLRQVLTNLRINSNDPTKDSIKRFYQSLTNTNDEPRINITSTSNFTENQKTRITNLLKNNLELINLKLNRLAQEEAKLESKQEIKEESSGDDDYSFNNGPKNQSDINKERKELNDQLSIWKTLLTQFGINPNQLQPQISIQQTESKQNLIPSNLDGTGITYQYIKETLEWLLKYSEKHNVNKSRTELFKLKMKYRQQLGNQANSSLTLENRRNLIKDIDKAVTNINKQLADSYELDLKDCEEEIEKIGNSITVTKNNLGQLQNRKETALDQVIKKTQLNISSLESELKKEKDRLKEEIEDQDYKLDESAVRLREADHKNIENNINLKKVYINILCQKDETAYNKAIESEQKAIKSKETELSNKKIKQSDLEKEVKQARKAYNRVTDKWIKFKQHISNNKPIKIGRNKSEEKTLLAQLTKKVTGNYEKLQTFYTQHLDTNLIHQDEHLEILKVTIQDILEKKPDDLSNKLSEEHVKELENFLEDRWKNIRYTQKAYDLDQKDKVNNICFELADNILKPAGARVRIDGQMLDRLKNQATDNMFVEAVKYLSNECNIPVDYEDSYELYVPTDQIEVLIHRAKRELNEQRKTDSNPNSNTLITSLEAQITSLINARATIYYNTVRKLTPTLIQSTDLVPASNEDSKYEDLLSDMQRSLIIFSTKSFMQTYFLSESGTRLLDPILIAKNHERSKAGKWEDTTAYYADERRTRTNTPCPLNRWEQTVLKKKAQALYEAAELIQAFNYKPPQPEQKEEEEEEESKSEDMIGTKSAFIYDAYRVYTINKLLQEKAGHRLGSVLVKDQNNKLLNYNQQHQNAPIDEAMIKKSMKKIPLYEFVIITGIMCGLSSDGGVSDEHYGSHTLTNFYNTYFKGYLEAFEDDKKKKILMRYILAKGKILEEAGISIPNAESLNRTLNENIDTVLKKHVQTLKNEYGSHHELSPYLRSAENLEFATRQEKKRLLKKLIEIKELKAGGDSEELITIREAIESGQSIPDNSCKKYFKNINRHNIQHLLSSVSEEAKEELRSEENNSSNLINLMSPYFKKQFKRYPNKTRIELSKLELENYSYLGTVNFNSLYRILLDGEFQQLDPEQSSYAAKRDHAFTDPIDCLDDLCHIQTVRSLVEKRKANAKDYQKKHFVPTRTQDTKPPVNFCMDINKGAWSKFATDHQTQFRRIEDPSHNIEETMKKEKKSIDDIHLVRKMKEQNEDDNPDYRQETTVPNKIQEVNNRKTPTQILEKACEDGNLLYISFLLKDLKEKDAESWLDKILIFFKDDTISLETVFQYLSKKYIDGKYIDLKKILSKGYYKQAGFLIRQFLSKDALIDSDITEQLLTTAILIGCQYDDGEEEARATEITNYLKKIMDLAKLDKQTIEKWLYSIQKWLMEKNGLSSEQGSNYKIAILAGKLLVNKQQTLLISEASTESKNEDDESQTNLPPTNEYTILKAIMEVGVTSDDAKQKQIFNVVIMHPKFIDKLNQADKTKLTQEFKTQFEDYFFNKLIHDKDIYKILTNAYNNQFLKGQINQKIKQTNIGQSWLTKWLNIADSEQHLHRKPNALIVMIEKLFGERIFKQAYLQFNDEQKSALQLGLMHYLSQTQDLNDQVKATHILLASLSNNKISRKLMFNNPKLFSYFQKKEVLDFYHEKNIQCIDLTSNEAIDQAIQENKHDNNQGSQNNPQEQAQLIKALKSLDGRGESYLSYTVRLFQDKKSDSHDNKLLEIPLPNNDKRNVFLTACEELFNLKKNEDQKNEDNNNNQEDDKKKKYLQEGLRIFEYQHDESIAAPSTEELILTPELTAIFEAPRIQPDICGILGDDIEDENKDNDNEEKNNPEPDSNTWIKAATKQLKKQDIQVNNGNKTSRHKSPQYQSLAKQHPCVIWLDSQSLKVIMEMHNSNTEDDKRALGRFFVLFKQPKHRQLALTLLLPECLPIIKEKTTTTWSKFSLIEQCANQLTNNNDTSKTLVPILKTFKSDLGCKTLLRKFSQANKLDLLLSSEAGKALCKAFQSKYLSETRVFRGYNVNALITNEAGIKEITDYAKFLIALNYRSYITKTIKIADNTRYFILKQCYNRFAKANDDNNNQTVPTQDIADLLITLRELGNNGLPDALKQNGSDKYTYYKIILDFKKSVSNGNIKTITQFFITLGMGPDKLINDGNAVLIKLLYGVYNNENTRNFILSQGKSYIKAANILYTAGNATGQEIFNQILDKVMQFQKTDLQKIVRIGRKINIRDISVPKLKQLIKIELNDCSLEQINLCKLYQENHNELWNKLFNPSTIQDDEKKNDPENDQYTFSTVSSDTVGDGDINNEIDAYLTYLAHPQCINQDTAKKIDIINKLHEAKVTPIEMVYLNRLQNRDKVYTKIIAKGIVRSFLDATGASNEDENNTKLFIKLTKENINDNYTITDFLNDTEHRKPTNKLIKDSCKWYRKQSQDGVVAIDNNDIFTKTLNIVIQLSKTYSDYYENMLHDLTRLSVHTASFTQNLDFAAWLIELNLLTDSNNNADIFNYFLNTNKIGVLKGYFNFNQNNRPTKDTVIENLTREYNSRNNPSIQINHNNTHVNVINDDEQISLNPPVHFIFNTHNDNTPSSDIDGLEEKKYGLEDEKRNPSHSRDDDMFDAQDTRIQNIDAMLGLNHEIGSALKEIRLKDFHILACCLPDFKNDQNEHIIDSNPQKDLTKLNNKKPGQIPTLFTGGQSNSRAETLFWVLLYLFGFVWLVDLAIILSKPFRPKTSLTFFRKWFGGSKNPLVKLHVLIRKLYPKIKLREGIVIGMTSLGLYIPFILTLAKGSSYSILLNTSRLKSASVLTHLPLSVIATIDGLILGAIVFITMILIVNLFINDNDKPSFRKQDILGIIDGYKYIENNNRTIPLPSSTLQNNTPPVNHSHDNNDDHDDSTYNNGLYNNNSLSFISYEHSRNSMQY